MPTNDWLNPTDWINTTTVVDDGSSTFTTGHLYAAQIMQSAQAVLVRALLDILTPNPTIQLNFAWYSDVGLTIPSTDNRLIWIDTNINNSSAFILVNRGRYLVPGTLGPSSTTYRLHLSITPISVAPTSTCFPVDDVILDAGTGTLASAGTVKVWPFDYYGGPARMQVQTATQPFNVWLYSPSSNGVYNIRWQGAMAPAASNTFYDLVLPTGAFYIFAQNAGGAAAAATITIVANRNSAT